MMRMIILGVTALTLFGLSAGVSWYLQRLKHSPSDATADADGTAASGHGGEGTPKASSAAHRDSGLPEIPRSSNKPSTSALKSDELVQITERLNAQEDELRRRQLVFAARQKHLDLIRQDIKGEQAIIDELRRKLSEEGKAIGDRLAALERKKGEVDTKTQESSKQLFDLQRTITEFESNEHDRIRQIASMYDSMDPVNAAKILQQLSDTEHIDIAVKILGMMKERQAAKVLSELQDPKVAVQLMDRLKGLKKPGAPATTK